MDILSTTQIEDILWGVVREILIPKFISLGMNASGEWIQSLEVRGDEIWGRHYTVQLVQGRSPGRMPPPSALARWAQVKLGVSAEDSIGVGWAIAKKIEKEGTNYYPQGTDLLEVLGKPRNKRLHNTQSIGIYDTKLHKIFDRVTPTFKTISYERSTDDSTRIEREFIPYQQSNLDRRNQLTRCGLGTHHFRAEKI